MNSHAMKTDKYELTMLQSALESGVAHKRAVFELFTRRLPAGRNYFVTAGTARAIEAIAEFRFTEEDLAYLSDHLNQETLDYLRDFRFTGDVSGYREGDVFFPFSPVLTIEGTFGEAVLLETILLSIMNYDCAVASAASRLRRVAKHIPLQELGARRVNEDAAVAASRAAYIAGWDGTSNLLAGQRYGVPVFGTSAHAFSLAHEHEVDAFRAQVKALGVGTTLLVDTYDIPQGIRNAVEVGGTELGAIRLDSGDPMVEIPAARELLDSLGAVNTRIIFSGDLDFELVRQIAENGLPCDGFGIGSAVVTGDGHMNCGFVYKLVEIEYEDGKMHPVAKKASGKGSIGGNKDVFRVLNDDFKIEEEHLITPQSGAVSPPGSEAVQYNFIVNGEIVKALREENPVEAARERHALSLRSLDLCTEVQVVMY